jgi:transcriptional regulator of acetoin/glycerol metabolism
MAMNDITLRRQLLSIDDPTRSDRPCADSPTPSAAGSSRPFTTLAAKSEGPRARWRISRLPADGASQRAARHGAATDDVQWAPLVALPDLLIPILLTSATEADRALFARRLHDLGARRHGPFVTVHCPGRSAEEIDFALFGDDTWNAAAEGVSDGGAVLAATGGTLYVDEVSRLALRTQAKLLHALERRRHPGVVTEAELPLDFRLIVATTADLRAEVRRGRFRASLLFAISGFALWVPPLAARPEQATAPHLNATIYLR